jgi:MoaA/NifB/PqqE/SkfB family radical SAM enzyme
MRASQCNYWTNLGKLLQGDHLLNPAVVSFYPTEQCNFNCTYCEDYGARRNPQAIPPLQFEQAQKVLEVVRTAVDKIILTGGEPLLYPHIDPLVKHAKKELHFHHVTMLSNGSLLHEHEEILPYLDRLMISLDSLDIDLWSTIIQMPQTTIKTIFTNIEKYASYQKKFGFRMVLNCVLTPTTLPNARQMIEFCVQNKIFISFSPQAVQNWPHYDLLVTDEYRQFLREVIDLKKKGAPIVGSLSYLQMLVEFHPYSCYPMLVPRIGSNGDMIYPCKPIEQENTCHGGRPVNLLEVKTWDEAVKIAREKYGPPPRVCTSCFQQCYAEASLQQGAPFKYLLEQICFAPSRQVDIISYAPG